MNDGVQSARGRLLAAFQSGDWERIPTQVDAYGAAVRADERQRVLDEATQAIKSVLGEEDDSASQLAEIRRLCLAALDKLR